MFARLRALFQRKTTSAPPTQQVLFGTQKTLSKELQALMRAYERRIEYLQARLLRLTAAEAQQDRPLFDEAHQSLARITARLRAADQEAEILVREWQDWLDQEQTQILSREAKERLEILRSELTVRGLLPPARASKPVVKAPLSKKPVSSYQPTVLTDDTLDVFDTVFLPRLNQETRWLDRAWAQSLAVGVRIPWKVWLTQRRKRVYGWKKRLQNVVR